MKNNWRADSTFWGHSKMTILYVDIPRQHAPLAEPCGDGAGADGGQFILTVGGGSSASLPRCVRRNMLWALILVLTH